jgi:hypothetical protein
MIMKVSKSAAVLFAAGSFGLAGTVRAVSVPLYDSNFELSTNTTSNGQGQCYGLPPGWGSSGGGTASVEAPYQATQFSTYYGGLNLNNSGNYIGYTQGVGCTYFTNVNASTPTFSANTTYTVTALFGNAYENTNGSATFELLDGTTHTVLASEYYAADVVRPNTANVSFTYDTATNGVGVGDPIEFAFVSGASGTEAFDNVAVDAVLDGGPFKATYVPTGSGDFNVAANWTTAVPNGVDCEADFLGSITSAQTVYSNSNITVGTMVFNNANTYVLAGAGALKFQVSTGSALVDTQAGLQKITLPIEIASNTTFNAGTGATLVIQAPVTVDPGMSLTTTTTGTGVVQFLSTITVDSGATFSLIGGSNAAALSLLGVSNAAISTTTGTKTALQLNTLSIASGSTFDVGNNDLVIHSGTVSAVQVEVATGFNGGAWNGSGIISTVAASDSTHLTAVGVMQNTNPTGGAIYSTFGNVPVSAGDILVKETYYGDANLDGVVDGSDYSLIDNGFESHLTGWYNGDFNYDGVVDGSDYTLIDNAFNSQGSSLASEIASPSAIPTAQIASGASAVPEPTSLGLLGIGMIGLLGRRRCSK